MTQLMEFLSDRLPAQDQRQLSFSGHQPKAFREWAESLPIVNIGETAKMLYQGVQELCHLKVTAAHRLQLLELIRPKVHYICEALQHHYDSNAILLSPKSRRVANLCQALQKHLAIGYKISLIDALHGGFLGTAREHIPMAMHRFLSELTFILLRCYQLYHPSLPQLWFEINLIYALAEEQALLEHRQLDTEIDQKRTLSISDLYKKAIILASSKPNQLQSHDLAALFYNSNQWANLVAVTSEPARSGLYAIALNLDEPPVYIKDMKNQRRHIRYIDMRHVLAHLHEVHANDSALTGIKAQYKTEPTTQLNEEMAKHLVEVWTRASKRINDRVPKYGMAQISLGLSNAHHFLSQGTPPVLPENKKADHENPVENIDMDVAINGELRIEKSRVPKDFTQHSCVIINISNQGICLSWQQNIPTSLNNKELVLVRQKASEPWKLGTIRWIRHFYGEGIRTGIHLMPTAAQPVNVRQYRDEDCKLLRAVLLPPSELGFKPSLITPKMGLRTGDQVILNNGEDHTVHLEKIIASHPNFNHFELKPQGQLFSFHTANANHSDGKAHESALDLDDELDDLWEEI